MVRYIHMSRLYNKYILPRLIDRAMRSEDYNCIRGEVASKASGIVLEIGFGSGYNLPFYGNNIEKLYALEPSDELYKQADERVRASRFPVHRLNCLAENIPLADDTVDTVLSTWTLCSIVEPSRVLGEICRILKPGGKFLFAEHGLSHGKISSLIQRTITPISRLLAGNCHLDRRIDEYIRNSKLTIENLDMSQEKGRPLMFVYKGVAVK